MISLIVFDLDGVLVDSRELHYESLNIALTEVSPHFAITHQEHLAKYDGLPTKDKLLILTKDKQLPEYLYERIKRRKQQLTLDMIKERIVPDLSVVHLFAKLKADHYTICVASNAVPETIDAVLSVKTLSSFVDKTFSNLDVKRAKPNPEIYLRCMIEYGVGPKETLIIEDSPYGLEAAYASCANVLRVKDSSEVTIDNLYKRLAS